MEPSLKQRVRFKHECLFSKNRKGIFGGYPYRRVPHWEDSRT